MELGDMFDPTAGRAHEAAFEADAILRVHAIVECELCDDDGYRVAVVCDHVDRADTHKRGMAKVRKALQKKPAGLVPTAEPEEGK